jgi:hypothetical protein
MKPHSLPAHYGRTVELDACHDCQVLWVDTAESQQLTSDGVVELFRIVHERAHEKHDKLAQRLGCVRCKSTLNKTHDQISSTRFHYHLCSKGHGRLITFYQFLAEKKFVRELTAVERARLSADIRQTRCNGCGAAVDLVKQSACDYCRAPVAVFDRDAAQKAIEHYLKRRHHVLPQQPQPVALPERGPTIDPAAYTAADVALDAVWAMAQFASRYASSRPALSAATIPIATEVANSFEMGDASSMLDLVSDGADAFVRAVFD